MNRLNYIAFSILTCLLLSKTAPTQAQSPSIDSLLSKALASDVLLPMLMDSAIKYSAEARMSRSSENLALANFDIKKKAVYNALSLHTSYGYGTNYAAVNNQSSTVPNNLTTAQSMYYNVGVGLQLPITQIINRKSIRKGS